MGPNITSITGGDIGATEDFISSMSVKHVYSDSSFSFAKFLPFLIVWPLCWSERRLYISVFLRKGGQGETKIKGFNMLNKAFFICSFKVFSTSCSVKMTNFLLKYYLFLTYCLPFRYRFSYGIKKSSSELTVKLHDTVWRPRHHWFNLKDLKSLQFTWQNRPFLKWCLSG